MARYRKGKASLKPNATVPSWRSCDLILGVRPRMWCCNICAVAVTPGTLALFLSTEGKIAMLLCATQKMTGCRKSDEMLRSKQKVLTYVA